MAQYIDKSALVAEIKKRKDEITFLNEFANGTKFGLETAIDVINTLEAKEIDLEKEVNDYGYHYDYVSLADRKELVDFAKHFFELGLQVQKGEEL